MGLVINDRQLRLIKEEEKRRLHNLNNRKGKTCANCHWFMKQEELYTGLCGHHKSNFSSSSFCDEWRAKECRSLASERLADWKRITDKLW